MPPKTGLSTIIEKLDPNSGGDFSQNRLLIIHKVNELVSISIHNSECLYELMDDVAEIQRERAVEKSRKSKIIRGLKWVIFVGIPGLLGGLAWYYSNVYTIHKD